MNLEYKKFLQKKIVIAESFGFEPKVSDVIQIDAVIAYCETLKIRAYCFCMRAEIIEKNEPMARVKTTQEWEKACGGYMENSVNNAGNIRLIESKNKAPNSKK